MSPSARCRHALALLPAATLGLLPACGDDSAGSGGGGGGTGGADATAPLKLVTWNAGLAYGFVQYAEERAPLVPPALAALDVDILCLNEVWVGEDVAAVKQALATKLPTAAFFEDMQQFADAPPCDPETLAPLVTCVADACGDTPEAACVLEFCNPEFQAQSGDCQQCLASNVGGPIDQLQAACSGDGALFAYDGAFGVGLLTNQAVTAQEGLVLEGSTINRRGVQYMRLDPGGAPLHVFCTHLTANLSIDYPREEGSWASEQAAQIDTIHGWIAERVGTDPVILMGDLNTGPSGTGFDAELESSWAKLADAGWVDPFLAQTPFCSYCEENPLVGGASDDVETTLIDHILFQRAGGTFAASRILDEEVALDTADDGPVVSRLSDHYGVRIEWTR